MAAIGWAAVALHALWGFAVGAVVIAAPAAWTSWDWWTSPLALAAAVLGIALIGAGVEAARANQLWNTDDRWLDSEAEELTRGRISKAAGILGISGGVLTLSAVIIQAWLRMNG